MDNGNPFVLQRMHELQSQDPIFLLNRDIERAKHDFPLVLEVRKDNLLGHHESYHLHVPSGNVYALLWDQDHDERIFIAAKELLNKLSENGKGLIQVFGERKGIVTLIVANENAKHSLTMALPQFVDCGTDSWQVDIISSETDFVSYYGVGGGMDMVPYIKNLLEIRRSLSHVWTCLELRDMEVKNRERARRSQNPVLRT